MAEVLSIAHRGAMGYEPENTLKAYQKALDLKADMIELDAFVCKSGEVVCFHDRKLNRTTNGKGFVVKKTLEQLKKLDAGKGEKIPTLEETLDLIDKKAKVNIELKGKRTLKPVLRIIRKYIVTKGWPHEHFLISSVERHKLRKYARAKANFHIGALLAYRPFGFLKFAQRIKAYSVHVNRRLLSRNFVIEAHERNLKVFVWTVDEPQEIKWMKAIGVDGIFTNYPDRI